MDIGLNAEARATIKELSNSFTALGKSVVKELKALNKNLEEMNKKKK